MRWAARRSFPGSTWLYVAATGWWAISGYGPQATPQAPSPQPEASWERPHRKTKGGNRGHRTLYQGPFRGWPAGMSRLGKFYTRNAPSSHSIIDKHGSCKLSRQLAPCNMSRGSPRKASMAVSAQPNLSCVPRVLRTVAQSLGPTRQRQFFGKGPERQTPPHPQLCSTRNGGMGGQGWRSVFQPLPGDAALTRAENQAVLKVMVLSGREAALEVQSPPPLETTRGTLAPPCGGTDDRKRVCVMVARSCLPVCEPTDCSPPGSSAHGDSPDKKTAVGHHALLQRDLPKPGIETWVSRIAGRFFTV